MVLEFAKLTGRDGDATLSARHLFGMFIYLLTRFLLLRQESVAESSTAIRHCLPALDFRQLITTLTEPLRDGRALDRKEGCHCGLKIVTFEAVSATVNIGRNLREGSHGSCF